MFLGSLLKEVLLFVANNGNKNAISTIRVLGLNNLLFNNYNKEIIMGKFLKNLKKAVNKAIKKEKPKSIVKQAAKQVGSLFEKELRFAKMAIKQPKTVVHTAINSIKALSTGSAEVNEVRSTSSPRLQA